jgi:hypothetical protein
MKAGKRVFLVVHHEIVPNGSGFDDYEMLFWVVSSIAIAIRYIRKLSVEPYSW